MDLGTKNFILLGAAAAAVLGAVNIIPLKIGLGLGAVGIVVGYFYPPMGMPTSS